MLLQSVRVRGVGCVKDATLTLTPLHALIGPNDAGKSTLLRALQAALADAQGARPLIQSLGTGARVDLSFEGAVELALGRDATLTLAGEPVPEGTAGLTVLAAGGRLVRHVKVVSAGLGATTRPGGLGVLPADQVSKRLRSRASQVDDGAIMAVAKWVEAPPIVRLDPDALRKRTSLLGTGVVRFRDARGTGLPGVLDAIRDRDDNAWSEIQKQVRALFPTVKQLRVSAVSANEKEVAIVLNDGTPVAAEHMSEGMLYVLGILAIVHGAPTSMVLMEEPENGLHPARIREVMGLLRKLSETVPVLLATHSPLVVNELKANEVTVVTRGDEGTHATLLSNTKDYASRSRAYENGELWLSYGDAEREKDLVSGAE